MKNEINEVTLFEIPAKDPEVLRKFYADVFGWKFKNSAVQNMQYWTIDTGTKHIPGVNGGMYKKGSEKETPVNYISTTNLDETIASVEKAGGHITVGKREVEGHGLTAIGVDPEGNSIGLFQSADRGRFRQRGKQSQSGANRVSSEYRDNMTADDR
ncbi:Glyoxalase/bleomycin resistance protein/dioxygenase [mine drainage metagenome]|uniref:Glyoxalase/bleomycin resistance protein/dioxygenase n=1 Tax=mine drainage metagenome TaxID=410659 RepID=T0ZYX2_9ZZZZ